MPAIPVTVLTGFLGAGKTSFLNRLLADPALADTAVVINEFGAVGLDHLLVETAGEGVALLAAGCLCCTIRGELIDTLEDLGARRDAGTLPPFRRVVIETSGLADPAPILQTLAVHPGLAARYALDGVVTLVDAVNGEATLDGHAESVRQAAVADRLVLTKADLAEAGTVDRLRRRLARLNPAAPVLDVREAAAGDVLGLGADLARWLGGDGHRHDHAHDHHAHDEGRHDAHHHGHDVDRHDDRIRSFSLASAAAVPPGRLETFLGLLAARHGPDLLRFKALVKLADDPERPVVLHAVQHVLHPPLRLERWPGEERTSRLVFIVRDIPPADIEALFAALLGEPRLDAPDFAALADNPLALR
ncbi:CobW family GTP-binding protein [Labrys wisconsinensis]|uniref:G3E family GTPase n=1 Tax=Labrys wisconsinensis TaxID=425677 RepID=A0ABU0J414_9HYPH|nr:GTP-binding protein [Labrys wisconsinensis]MDQ0467942.1 G3E family GTPase [Labrys wisconsinensis]